MRRIRAANRYSSQKPVVRLAARYRPLFNTVLSSGETNCRYSVAYGFAMLKYSKRSNCIPFQEMGTTYISAMYVLLASTSRGIPSLNTTGMAMPSINRYSPPNISRRSAFVSLVLVLNGLPAEPEHLYVAYWQAHCSTTARNCSPRMMMAYSTPSMPTCAPRSFSAQTRSCAAWTTLRPSPPAIVPATSALKFTIALSAAGQATPVGW